MKTTRGTIKIKCGGWGTFPIFVFVKKHNQNLFLPPVFPNMGANFTFYKVNTYLIRWFSKGHMCFKTFLITIVFFQKPHVFDTVLCQCLKPLCFHLPHFLEFWSIVKNSIICCPLILLVNSTQVRFKITSAVFLQVVIIPWQTIVKFAVQYFNSLWFSVLFSCRIAVF